MNSNDTNPFHAAALITNRMKQHGLSANQVGNFTKDGKVVNADLYQDKVESNRRDVGFRS